MYKINFKKVLHLDDFLSDNNSVMNSQSVWFGDDVYHDHDFYEIAYITNGQISHCVNEQEMDLTLGDIIFFRPKDRHAFLRNKSNARHRDIVFKKEFFLEVLSFLGEDFANTYNSPELPLKINVTPKKLEEFESLIDDYFFIQHENAKEKLLQAKLILVKLLDCLIRNLKAKEEPDVSCRPWLKNLLRQMHMREMYKEGLSAILSRFDFNYSYMCNAFKKYTGVTMTEYLNDLRLQYAASLIKLTDNSILAISQEAGFVSISYFNKLFKQKYGCTPKEYRLNKLVDGN